MGQAASNGHRPILWTGAIWSPGWSPCSAASWRSLRWSDHWFVQRRRSEKKKYKGGESDGSGCEYAASVVCIQEWLNLSDALYGAVLQNLPSKIFFRRRKNLHTNLKQYFLIQNLLIWWNKISLGQPHSCWAISRAQGLEIQHLKIENIARHRTIVLCSSDQKIFDNTIQKGLI